MLNCLRVRNFAIIDELELSFGSGLNVVTGETGAGKSILIAALELVLGAKGRPEVVRTGEQQAEVEALFDVSGRADFLSMLRESGLDNSSDSESNDTSELLVRRVVYANGRTRAYINGRMATQANLKALAAGMADISSQHEHHSLVSPKQHLSYLDSFAKLEPQRKRVADAHDLFLRAKRAVADLSDKAKDGSEREDLLRYQAHEIAEVAPKPGEIETLERARGRLRHAEKLARVAGEAEDALYASDHAICAVVGKLASDVNAAASLDPSLLPFAGQLDRARAELEDAARELGAYARDVQLDPSELSHTEDRLDAIRKLTRKYGNNIDAVLEHQQAAEAELSNLAHYDERIREFEEQLESARAEAREQAMKLSAARRTAAVNLGRAISSELSSLGMGGARVQVNVTPLSGEGSEVGFDGHRMTRTGIDHVEFMIAPNPGEEAKPLKLIASGGELSRALLGIKRVLAGLKPTGLYVFDEVDAGVGGAVAEVIGQKMRDVAEHSQVLCITHLPQIAAYADTHFRVQKAVEDGRTRSEVAQLGETARLEEMARMLGGIKITKKTRAAAKEMLVAAGR